jgi:glycerophosphoryl diester phosphodiesterase
MAAYRIAGAIVPPSVGSVLIEQDVQILEDGSLGCMHDDTVDRTTTGTGNCSTFDATSWKRILLDPSAWFGGGWTDTEPPPLFGDVLRELGNRNVLVPEAKSTAVLAPMLKMLSAYGINKERVIIQSFDASTCVSAIAAGWYAMHIGNTDIAAAAASGISFVAPDAAWAGLTAGYITAAHAAGIKVIPYTVSRRYMWSALQAIGCDGCFTDAPQYLLNIGNRTSDAFYRQTWIPGLQQSASSRGLFYSPSTWGFPTASTFASTLHGYLTPTSDSFVMNFTMQFDAVDDPSRWGSVFIGNTDYMWYDGGAGGATGFKGYHILLRANGQVSIYRFDDNASVKYPLVSGDTGIPAVLGAPFNVRITVSAGAIDVTKTSGGSPTGATVTSTDTSHRGRYIHLCRIGCAVKYSAVSVS